MRVYNIFRTPARVDRVAYDPTRGGVVKKETAVSTLSPLGCASLFPHAGSARACVRAFRLEKKDLENYLSLPPPPTSLHHFFGFFPKNFDPDGFFLRGAVSFPKRTRARTHRVDI